MISAVVLAAGQSIRMGKTKQLLRLKGKPLLEHVLEHLLKSKVDDIIVVLGSGSERIMMEVELQEVKVVVNESYEDGMSSSLKAGIKALSGNCDAFIVTLADQPFIGTSTLNAVIDAYLAGKGLIGVPIHDGQRGNPVLFDMSLACEILTISGDQGAKKVLHKHETDVYEIEVNTPSIFVDIDTETDFDEAKRMLG